MAEIIDPRPVRSARPPEGVEARLVYTALRRRASPLFRFRSRDHVVVTGTDCACGRTGIKIRCVGRTDDMLIVRGINLFPSAVKQLVSEFRPATNGEMRIRADFDGHSTQKPLNVVVEARNDLSEDDRTRLRDAIETRVRSALNVKVHVELLPEFTLKRPDHVKVQLVERV